MRMAVDLGWIGFFGIGTSMVPGLQVSPKIALFSLADLVALDSELLSSSFLVRCKNQ
jgi:hypothetical protein